MWVHTHTHIYSYIHIHICVLLKHVSLCSIDVRAAFLYFKRAMQKEIRQHLFGEASPEELNGKQSTLGRLRFLPLRSRPGAHSELCPLVVVVVRVSRFCFSPVDPVISFLF